MKKILIPTDFSRNAWNAICYALDFFKNEACTFYFLHTYTPAFYRMDYMLGGPAYSAIPDVGIDISIAGLEKTLKDVQEQFPNPNHTYETISAFNTLTDEINELSEKEMRLEDRAYDFLLYSVVPVIYGSLLLYLFAITTYSFGTKDRFNVHNILP